MNFLRRSRDSNPTTPLLVLLQPSYSSNRLKELSGLIFTLREYSQQCYCSDLSISEISYLLPYAVKTGHALIYK